MTASGGTRGRTGRAGVVAVAAVLLAATVTGTGAAGAIGGAGAVAGAPRTTFSDVGPDHPFATEIGWGAAEGIIEGYADGTFRPTATVTRQALVAFLFRLSGQPASVPPLAPFPDVPLTHPFVAEISWASTEGITTGYADGTFRPTATVTRQAAAAMIARFAEWSETGPVPPPPFAPGTSEVAAPEPRHEGAHIFVDVHPDHPFRLEIALAAGASVLTGYPDRTFRSTVPLTRQAAAAVVYRLHTWLDPDYLPVWTAGSCTVLTPVGHTTECGTLTVPERRDDPGGDTIDLAVAIVHTNDSTPAADPVVYLGGGPGGTVMDGLRGRYKAVLGEERDVILFDQRGVGLSDPNLDCPESDDALYDTYETADPYADELDVLLAAAEDCRDRLVGDGVDLSAYNTVENALDVRDLRRALGYDAWNVYGVSYGTALAQQVVRIDPFGTRSVVYDSVYNIDDTAVTRLRDSALRVYEQLWQGCAADVSCAAAHADLEAEFLAAVASYDATPQDVTIPAPGGGTVTLSITGSDLAAGLFAALYRTDVIPLLPGLVTAIQARDTTLLTVIAQQGLDQLTALADGMTFSVECHDRGVDASRAAAEAVVTGEPLVSTLYLSDLHAFCETLGVPSAPWWFNTLPQSTVPGLVLAGAYDPVTPPQGGMALADSLETATYVEFPQYGHGVLTSTNTCGATVVRSFLSAPAGAPDTACVATQLPPDF